MVQTVLAALQAQVEAGDLEENIVDYRVIASHCLPTRLVPNISYEAVMKHHQILGGMTSTESKKAFLNLIRSWPLHRATIFDVMVTCYILFLMSFFMCSRYFKRVAQSARCRRNASCNSFAQCSAVLKAFGQSLCRTCLLVASDVQKPIVWSRPEGNRRDITEKWSG